MTYNATLYKNTGFNTVDRPDTPALVKTFSSVNASALYTKQNAPLEKVRIQKGFDDIKNCDYLELGNMFYFITDIRMLNDNVCELTITEDSVTSLGGPTALNFIDGWCERKHTTDDTIFSNVIPENFSPRDVMKLEGFHGHPMNYETGMFTFIASTVDLTSVQLTADVYVGTASGQNYEVTVPSIPSGVTPTTISIISDETDSTLDKLTAKTPGYALFDYSNTVIQDAVQKIRALGLETVLVGCYVLPIASVLETQTTVDGYVSKLRMKYWSNDKFENNEYDPFAQTPGEQYLTYKYGNYTPKNKKVYSQYNDITVFSMASGDSQTYKAHDIYDGTGADIPFVMASNGSPDGMPYLRPKFFENKEVDEYNLFENAVKGGIWLNSPLVLKGASGSEIIDAKRKLQTEAETLTINPYKNLNWDARETMDIVNGYITPVMNALKNPSVSSVLGATTDVVNYNPLNMETKLAQMENERMTTKLAYELEKNVVAPDVKFTQSLNLQMFIGNMFSAFRIRLSEADLERFDKYLTLYGYATSEPLTTSCFTGRTNFNFVQASGVSIEKTTSQTYAENDNRMRRVLAASQLSEGIRFWHVKPESSKRFNNPITTP